MRISKTISILGLLTGLAACSGQDSEHQNSGETKVSASEEIVNDQTLAGEDISNQTSEAVSSSLNVDSSSGLSLAGGLNLTLDAAGEDEENEERSCVVDSDAGTTSVSISKSHIREKSITKNNYSQDMSMSRSMQLTRVWKKEGQEIACNEDNTHISLDPDQFEGVVLNASFSKEYSMAFTKVRGDESKSRNRSGSTSGERTVTWTSVSVSDDDIVTTQKQIALNISSSMTRLDKDGNDKDASFTLTTGENDPLVVEVTRNKGSKDWLTRKVVSGTTTAAHADGGKIVLTYADALFNYENECDPVSGTISGQIFLPESDTPARTFVADLEAEKKVITFSDGSTEELDMSGCEMDRPGKKIVKKVAKNLQKKIAKKVRKKLAEKSSTIVE